MNTRSGAKTARKAVDIKPRFVTVDGREKFKKHYTRREVAKLLGKSRQSVDYYVRKGVLVRVMSASCPWRSIGYTAESVRALVEGKGAANG